MALDIATRRAQLRDRFASWTPRTLHERLDECAAAYGARPFVITGDRTVSYAETAQWSRRLANGLTALGVRPGDRVGMLMANYLEFIPLKFAISRTGAVAIPFNYLYRRDELGYVLAQSECNVLITMTGFMGLDYLGMLDEIAPGWDTAGGDLTLAALPQLRHVLLLPTDGRHRDGVAGVDALAALGDQHAGASDAAPVQPGDVGDILYTSGTTGSPKGVMVTHDAVQRTGYASALTRAYEDGRRVLFSLPCYHMFGYVEGLLPVMFVGGAIIPQTTFSPEGYLRGVQQHRATDILCVPTMAVAIIEHPALADYDRKLLAENETDGYHPQFVHGSIFGVTGSPIGALYSDKSTAVTRDLGGGHSENDLRPEFRKSGEPMRWFGTTADRVPGYAAAMREAYGADAEQIMIEGGPHVMIFPNLFVAEIQVFNIQPVAADECVQYVTAVQLKGAKELNRRMVSQSIGSVGPAGMLLADDTEMYERNQAGVAALRPEWLDISRGMARESTDAQGHPVGGATDEVGMRGFWAHYRALMEAS